MKTKLLQLGGIIRSEIRMQWRRGSLRTLAFVLFAGQIVLTILMAQKPGDVQAAIAAGALSVDRQETLWTALAIVSASMIVGLLSIVVLALVADTIALDRHYRVNEVISSLPVTPGVYLTGKLFSVWGPALALLAASGLISAGIIRSSLGAFDIGLFAGYWLIDLLPFALYTIALGPLWAARAPSQRRATLIGFMLIPVCAVSSAIVVGDFFFAAGTRSVVATSTFDLALAPPYPGILSGGNLIKPLTMVAVVVASWLIVRHQWQTQEHA